MAKVLLECREETDTDSFLSGLQEESWNSITREGTVRRETGFKRGGKIHNLGIKGRIHIFCACEPSLLSHLNGMPLPSILAAVPVVFSKPNTEQRHFTVADVQTQSSDTGLRIAGT